MHFLYDKNKDSKRDIFSIQNEEDATKKISDSMKLMKMEITKLKYNDLTIIPDHREGAPVISNLHDLLPEHLIPMGKNKHLGKMKI